MHSAVLRGKGLKEYQTFGKQDVFCVLRCGNDERRSEIVADGAANPVFGDCLSVQSMFQSAATLEVWSRARSPPDKLIGVCTVNLDEVRRRLLGRRHGAGQWVAATCVPGFFEVLH